MIAALWTVLRKEVIENLRDRQVMTNVLLLGPLLGPVLIGAIIAFVAHREQEKAEKPLEIPVIGVEHAPNLIAFLKNQQVIIKPPVDDPEALIKRQAEDVIVRIPAEFGEDWRAGRSATVELIHDASRRDAQTAVARVERLLEAYGSQMGLLRLQVRGIDPSITRAVMIKSVDLSTPESRGGMLFAFFPYVMMMGLFTGAMYLAIDLTAGEKERQSLEALLINPVDRSAVILGKLGATVSFAILSEVLMLIAYAVVLKFTPTAAAGIKLSLDALTISKLFVILLPVAVLFASLQTLISAYAKGTREAQSFVGILILLPMIPGMLQLIAPVKDKLWMFTIPLWSETILLNKLLRGESPPLLEHAISMATTLALAAMLVFICTGLYKREKLLFSTS
jgi:sodium transport system permease protein